MDEIAAIIPPTDDISVEEFIATARLRPNEELASLAEAIWKRRSTLNALISSDSSEAKIEYAINHHRYIAILWIMDPDMRWV